MGHKTKADRQREARERLSRGQIDLNIEAVKNRMRWALAPQAQAWDIQELKNEGKKLVSNFMIAGKTFEDAMGNFRSILFGGSGGGWLSGPDDVDEAVESARRFYAQKKE